MAKSKTNLHSDANVKVEVDDDVKPLVINNDLGNGVTGTPVSAKVGQV